MSRKKRIQEFNQIDGRDHKIEITKSVDEIFGFEKAKFNTSSAAEYEKILKEMNKPELYDEGLKLGLIPIDDRFVLQERIMKEFSKHNSAIAAARNTPNQINISKRGRDLLAEGA